MLILENNQFVLKVIVERFVLSLFFSEFGIEDYNLLNYLFDFTLLESEYLSLLNKLLAVYF